MLLSIINSSTSFVQILIEVIIRLPAVMLAISFHEAAHGYIAYKCGDPTAKIMGRVSMNPFVHFDLIGAISMFLVGFGWAKPVGVNPNNLKNIRVDTALVAIAGPVSNFIMATLAMILNYILIVVFGQYLEVEVAGKIISIAQTMISLVVLMNISLMIFNLVPIPPLDGSKVLFAFLPAKCYNFILKYERYGFLILFVVLMTGIIDRPLNIAMSWVFGIINNGVYTLFSAIGLI